MLFHAHYLTVFGINHLLSSKYLRRGDFNSQLKNPQIFPNQWKRFIKNGDVVLDIGAYIGIISIYFAALGARVYAIEGSIRNYKRLKEVCKSFPQIKPIHISVSNENKKISTRFNDCIRRDHPMQEVQYVVYDEHSSAHNIPDPTFVKMDIEGMETYALLGMSRLIEEVRPVWQIECHKGIEFVYEGYPGYVPVADGGFDFNVFPMLDYLVTDAKAEEVAIDTMKLYENYFFIPKEKCK